MAELGNVLLVVLCVNGLLFLGQIAALELNPDGPQFYNCEDGLIGQFEIQGCTTGTYVLNVADPASKLPNQGSQVEINNGNVFTDTFSAAVNWFTRSTGLNYLYSILASPANFLIALHVPDVFAFALGAMWYGFTLLTIIAFILGRDY